MTDKSKPRHWRDHIRRMNPDYLYAEDLGPPGTKFDVEVIKVEPAQIKNPGAKKAVFALTFAGARKKFGIGATCCKTMRKLSGTDDWSSPEWLGWITLVVIHTRYQDSTTGNEEETDAIRIAPVRPRRDAQPSGRSQRDIKPGDPTPEEQAKIEQLEREGKS